MIQVILGLQLLIQKMENKWNLKEVAKGMLMNLKEYTENDNCYYTIYRVVEKIDESVTIKFALIKHLGEKVKPMQRGKIFGHTGSVQKKSLLHIILLLKELWMK